MEFREPIGTGPGPITTDGCSVELYKRTPYRGELDVLEPRLTGKTVLELGCGVGRLTSRLISMGCEVLAVDESSEMLDCLSERVVREHTEIENLRLDRLFEVVLLASYLYNSPLPEIRQALARVARLHLKRDGCFLLQIHSQDALTLEQGHTSESDGITTTVERVQIEDSVIDATIRYSIDDLSWTHAFQTAVLRFDELEHELAVAGFHSIEWADEPNGWVIAK